MRRVTKKEMKEYIRAKLGSSVGWAHRALEVIYSFQTQAEQVQGTTADMNGVGFTGFDAEILTSFAEQLSRKGSLSPKQDELLLKKMKKYWRQILDNSDLERLSLLIVTKS